MGGFREADPETCRRAYEQMQADGTLSRRRLEVVGYLVTHTKPMTAGVIARGLRTNRNNVATRLSELEHLGVVQKAREQVCEVSGKHCWAWALTGDQPSGEIPRGTSKAALHKKQAEDMGTLINDVVNWLETHDEFKNNLTLRRAARRMRERKDAILGKDKD